MYDARFCQIGQKKLVSPYGVPVKPTRRILYNFFINFCHQKLFLNCF